MMSAEPTEKRRAWRDRLHAAPPWLVAVGLLLLVAAWRTPDSYLGARGWTQEDAVEHQRISAELHQLTFADRSDPKVQQRLRESRAEFAETESALSGIRDSINRNRVLLSGAGVVCLLMGIAAAYASR